MAEIDEGFFQFSRHRRGKGGAQANGGDLVTRGGSLARPPKQRRIGAFFCGVFHPGFKGLYNADAQSPLAQMLRQSGGNQSFADSGVGAGNKNAWAKIKVCRHRL
jgi:hypothetical protein